MKNRYSNIKKGLPRRFTRSFGCGNGNERNLTYDRKVCKLDPEVIRKLNQKIRFNLLHMKE